MPDFGGSVAALNEFADLLEIGLSQVFKDDIPTHPKMYASWIAEKGSKEWIEDELVFTGFGQMGQKDLGGPISTDKPLISSPKDFTLIPYALGFVGEFELIRWDKYSCFKNLTKMLARSGVDKKNILAYAILNNGFSTTDPVFTTYSNEALFSNAHALLRGGTGKNAPTTATDLSYLSMQEAITDFATLTNEDGLFIMLSPKMLIVHPSKRWVADTLVRSDYRPDNANMALNTVANKGLSVHDSPYLTSTGAWFMCCDKRRLQISFRVGDDLQFRRSFEPATWNQVYSMYGSFNQAVLHWYGVWGSQGT